MNNLIRLSFITISMCLCLGCGRKENGIRYEDNGTVLHTRFPTLPEGQQRLPMEVTTSRGTFLIEWTPSTLMASGSKLEIHENGQNTSMGLIVEKPTLFGWVKVEAQKNSR